MREMERLLKNDRHQSERGERCSERGIRKQLLYEQTKDCRLWYKMVDRENDVGSMVGCERYRGQVRLTVKGRLTGRSIVKNTIKQTDN